jgi:hypothetical protein
MKKTLAITLLLAAGFGAPAVQGTHCPKGMHHGEHAQAMEHGMHTMADKVIDHLIKFNDMEKGHKKAWINYAKKHHEAKYDLLKRHSDDWSNLRHHSLEALKTEGLSLEHLVSKLKHKVALHERHVEEWREMCQHFENKAKEIYHKNKKELEEFKESVRMKMHHMGKMHHEDHMEMED